MPDMEPDLPPYQVVHPHWFFCQQADNSTSWHPFSREDSEKLENVYTTAGLKKGIGEEKGDDVVVSVEGGRYDVHFKERMCHAVYWAQPPNEVRRCTWFYKEKNDGRFTPYREDFSNSLEEAYRIAVTLDEWKRKLEFPSGETVILDNPKLIMQYQSPGSEKTRPRTVRRGVDNISIEIPDGEPEQVDHLVFMVHGIGPACDLSFRSIIQCVNDFRKVCLNLLASHYKLGQQDGKVGRVEFLPVNWHSALHGDDTGVDKDIQSITLPSVSRLRHFINNTLIDVFFYHSPTYCQTIMDTVVSEVNTLHTLFRQRHPEFTGAVSVAGHSLGSLILFDLLTNQMTARGETVGEETPVDEPCPSASELPPRNPSPVDQDGDQSLGVSVQESNFHSSIVGDEYFNVGIGQLSINYPQLEFRPQSFFAFGSPLGMFLRVRGVKRIDPNYTFPTCKSFYNIFHPYDPVAYRMEPIIGPECDQMPMRIPHYRGHKRMHELKDSLTHMGTDLKNALGSIKTAFQSFARRPLAATPPAIEESEDTTTEGNIQGTPGVQDEAESSVSSEETEAAHEIKVGMLNGGRRIDYVLQETPFKSFTDYLFPFSEYLFATQSHLCYWESKDTALLLLKEIYNELGVPSEPPQ